MTDCVCLVEITNYPYHGISSPDCTFYRVKLGTDDYLIKFVLLNGVDNLVSL